MNCLECSARFEVTPTELNVVEKIFLPRFAAPPLAQCPSCRMRQRLAFRNERKLYRGACAKTGKPIITLYRPGAPYTVYDPQVWWSDDYDPLDYGREIDFSRPFFEQFGELHRAVPKAAIHNAKSENCDYTNYSANGRNSYLVVGAMGAEDSLYSYRIFFCNHVVDCYGMAKSELCYECIQSSDLHSCIHAMSCHSSSGLIHCFDCVGCHDCFGCAGLRGARNHIFNEPVPASQYASRVTALRADPAAEETFRRLRDSLPQRATYAINCEECSGDHIRNCQRCSDVFFVSESQDVVHTRNVEQNHDCAHANFADCCELQYQSTNLQENYSVAFAALAWFVSDSFYILSCFNSKKLFGCCGMKRHECCILNRPYSPADYEKTIDRLAAHMVETGEWGRFFPPSTSPFLFSETVAAELFPLSDAECARRGFNRGEPPVQPEAAGANERFPRCRSCSRQFRIIAQEEAFYKKLGLPHPEHCPDCRHRARFAALRPTVLRPARCARCGIDAPTTAPKGDVLCETCYLTAMGEA